MTLIGDLAGAFGISQTVTAAAACALQRTQTCSYRAQERVAVNVLRAFALEGIAESDFAASLGYGYDDPARDRYESLLCRIFGCERALARLTFASGTHAIVAAIAACVPPGKMLVSITGKPYDTLRNAITGAEHSLTSQGVQYTELDWLDCESASPGCNADAVFIQRSRGYAPRKSVSITQMRELITRARGEFPGAVILVDNCYGELVEEFEPTHAGADLVMGSLIKNLGGTFAPGGGYVAGRADLVERVAARVYAPGLRTALGPTLGFGRAFIQGLFAAPLAVEQSLRGLDFAAALFDELGYGVDPAPGGVRTDIVQAVRLGDPHKVLAFARGLQQAMPVNARFAPEPGRVPGYTDPVVMSAGAFVSGATIELSCDAPLREPFEVYLQGGVQFAHGVLGAMLAAQGLQP